MKSSILLGRILFSSVFIMSAPGHFSGDAIQMAASHGVPAANVLEPLSGIVALVGGLSVLVGYKGRLGAWLLILFLIPVTLVMHNFWAVHDPADAKMQQMMFMKNIAILGGALFIAWFGTGPLSVGAPSRVVRVVDTDVGAARPAGARL
jgi:putative oxidoreductase